MAAANAASISGHADDNKQLATSLKDLNGVIYRIFYSGDTTEEICDSITSLELNTDEQIFVCRQLFQASIVAYWVHDDKFFPRVAVRLCRKDRIYVKTLEEMFIETYNIIETFDRNALRYVTKFWSYILSMYSISWRVFSCIKLDRNINEDIETPSSRFIQMVFLDLIQYIGLEKLKSRIKDSRLQAAFEGLFPHDDLERIIFSLEFFTSIDLEDLTVDLRAHIAQIRKLNEV